MHHCVFKPGDTILPTAIISWAAPCLLELTGRVVPCKLLAPGVSTPADSIRAFNYIISECVDLGAPKFYNNSCLTKSSAYRLIVTMTKINDEPRILSDQFICPGFFTPGGNSPVVISKDFASTARGYRMGDIVLHFLLHNCMLFTRALMKLKNIHGSTSVAVLPSIVLLNPSSSLSSGMMLGANIKSHVFHVCHCNSRRSSFF
ncbi:hypothetical protein BJX99DRAFT_128872 [Aspergillus californicus]